MPFVRIPENEPEEVDDDDTYADYIDAIVAGDEG